MRLNPHCLIQSEETMKKTLLTLAATSVLSMSAQAEQFWADNSISVLYSSDYEFNKDVDTTTTTFEHVSGHSWGGVFFFLDRHNGGDFSETYSEFSPTYNLAKMDGFVSGINAAFTYESTSVNKKGAGSYQNLDNFLFGLGADLKVPGLDFANATVFYADNNEAFGNSTDYQLTLVAGYTQGNFAIDGFMDYAFGSDVDDIEDSMNLTPQITYNMGPMLGLKSKLKVGVEYSYWTNQFGVDGQDQNAVSLLLKAHL